MHKTTPGVTTLNTFNHQKESSIDLEPVEANGREAQSSSSESDLQGPPSSTALPALLFGPLSSEKAHEISSYSNLTDDCEPMHMDWILRDAGDRVDLNAFNYSSDHIPVDHTSHLLWSTYQNPFNVAQEPASKYKENGLQQEAWLLDPPELAEQSLDIPGLGGHRTDQSKAASYTQLRDLTDDDRDRIQQAAKACLEDPIWAPISFTAFPSKEKLDHCIDLFFVNFQPVSQRLNKQDFGTCSILMQLSRF